MAPYELYLNMNIVRLRHSLIYKAAVRLTNNLAKLLPMKLWTELLYWRLRKLDEGDLTNGHYEEFFTIHFGLSIADYKGKRVLDIGCGPRGSLEWVSAHADCFGLDPLANAYLKMGAEKHRMKYIQGISEAMPFDDASFDIVSSFNSLDHVDDLGNSIAEIKRVIKPGGYFLLIADIHPIPTVTEPSNFSWSIVDQFTDSFIVLRESHYEGHQLYRSIRAAIPFDHTNSTERYGILTVLFQRK